MDPSVTREDVKAVVKSCEQCQRIDPAPSTRKPGKLSVKSNWSHLALYVTHYKGKCYLTMVDCGPGSGAGGYRDGRTGGYGKNRRI